MTKKFISIIISFILFTVCIPFTAIAKVIEPEVVKTEKWTTSYYIDDDIDTLYPYIQCEADIYNDGTIKLYMWNTHEWDGFATVSHTATIIQTLPVIQDSMVYNFVNCKEYFDPSYSRSLYPVSKYGDTNINMSEYSDIDISVYPNNYTCYGSDYNFCGFRCHNYYVTITGYNSYGYTYRTTDIYYPRFSGALPKMAVQTNKDRVFLTLSPKVDPTGTYNFRLFGHDITITPELLSGNIVATPSTDGYKEITYNNGNSVIQFKTDIDISGIQNYIDKLEAENASLKQQTEEMNNRINLLSTGVYGDVNGDEVVDIQDAQIILAYYTQKDVALMDVPDLVTFGLNFGKG